MPEDPLQILDMRLVIAVACLQRAAVRSFAGCGRSRRRDLHLVPEMAEEIASSMSLMLLFTRQGIPVIRSRVIRHIESVLHDIPDAMARNWNRRHRMRGAMTSGGTWRAGFRALHSDTSDTAGDRAFGECLVRGEK